MQDPANELLRISLPRTPVNKRRKEGLESIAPALARVTAGSAVVRD
jgi:hypothetical protein